MNRRSFVRSVLSFLGLGSSLGCAAVRRETVYIPHSFEGWTIAEDGESRDSVRRRHIAIMSEFGLGDITIWKGKYYRTIAVRPEKIWFTDGEYGLVCHGVFGVEGLYLGDVEPGPRDYA